MRELIVKYVGNEADKFKADEMEHVGDWIHFYRDGNKDKVVAIVRADKVLSITRLDEDQTAAEAGFNIA